jgi:predicted nucleic acid-binding Zn ribbon protein
MQKMSDDPLEVCDSCGGRLRKVLHPVAIHFKGSGFYTTDYGRGSGRRAAAREGGAEGEGPSGGASSAASSASPPDKAAAPGGETKAKESKAAT